MQKLGKNNKIGFIFKQISYDIDDISRMWYSNGSLEWRLKSVSTDFSSDMSKERAQKYIDAFNSLKYSKIINF